MVTNVSLDKFIHVSKNNSMIMVQYSNWNLLSDSPCSETEESKR